MAKATQWPSRIVLHHCPSHGFVEQDFLDALDEANPDACPIPRYDEEPCGDRLDAGTVEYVHKAVADALADAVEQRHTDKVGLIDALARYREESRA